MAIQLNSSAADTYVAYDGTAAPISASGANDFTIAAWVSRETDTGTVDNVFGAFDASSGTASGRYISVNASDNYIVTGATTNTLTAATLAQWTYLTYGTTGIYDGDSRYGTSTTLTNVAASVGTNTTLFYLLLGRYTDGTSYFKGKIAHFRAWKSKLTLAQLEAEMVSATPVITANLYLDWEFDGNANDGSGNGRNGTITGSTFAYVDGPLAGGASAVISPSILRPNQSTVFGSAAQRFT